MAFDQETWYDAPNPNTPLSAARMNDLEQRIADAVGGVSAVDDSPSVRLLLASTQNISSGGVGTYLSWPDAEQWDSDNMHYTSSAALTGTVSKTASGSTLTGSGTSFTSQLSVGQVIGVPGTQTEYRVVTAIASNTSLTIDGTWQYTASGQTATRDNQTIVLRTSGIYIVTANISWPAGSTGQREIGIVTLDNATYNGTTFWGDDRKTALATGLTKQSAGAHVYSPGWRMLRMYVFQNQGSNLDANGASMGATRVSAGGL